MNRIQEFWEADNGRMSMARLLQFLSFPPATGILIYMHTTEALSMYLSAYVLNGIANKGIDKWGVKKR